MVTREHILSEAKRLFEKDNRSPGHDRFESETGVKAHEWQRFFARWNDVLSEAGLPQNRLQAKYPIEGLLDTYISLARELGRLPTSGDIRVKSHALAGFPHGDTFIRGLGKKSEQVQRLLKYCRDRDGFEDIVRMCEEYVPRSHEAVDGLASEPDFGFVYLAKSGRCYKIGKTNAVGRREYELAIQLPEKLRQIHVIKTDDPGGIEAYWHKRFEAKRRNGEWFELDAKDVAAFKRRKFFM